MTRNRTIVHTQSLGQVGLRAAAGSPKGLDAWIFRAATEHPFEPAGVEPSCASHDPELFWPATEADAEQARTVCRACPLVETCLAVARLRLEWGVWGGQLLAKGRPTTELPGNVRPSSHDTARIA
ncbi:hypothetical protein GCM10009868_40450 [Terrabacter aerolatus]|uniref:4Fe-4S Wbl-type domain-containing protein n=1 Tax=Terrabacter aerolatus TaxID=422442 RepID=A0A512D676_9MICO|nr:WhiB family transcriptional regulator [Terrabacter aerolatus]GEO31978.1 hypothetical protein TAE01_37880 [Terrabacter aerolatus]